MCIRVAKFPSFIKGTVLAQVPLRAEAAKALCGEFTLLGNVNLDRSSKGRRGVRKGRKERKHVLLSLSQSPRREPGAQVCGTLCWKMKPKHKEAGQKAEKQRAKSWKPLF